VYFQISQEVLILRAVGIAGSLPKVDQKTTKKPPQPRFGRTLLKEGTGNAASPLNIIWTRQD